MFNILSQCYIVKCVEKSEKIQDFKVVWTCDLAMPVRRSNQLSYEVRRIGIARSRVQAPLESCICSGFSTQLLRLSWSTARIIASLDE